MVQKRRPKSQRGEGAQLKLDLIAAAMRFLDRAPASELSLRMVANETGVSPTSAYKHFANAGALMADVVRECWRQLGAQMVTGAALAPDHDALASLQQQMQAYVRYAMERPSRYQLLFALEPIEFDAPVDLPGPVQPAYRSVCAAITQAVAQGRQLPMPDVHFSALLTLSIAHGRVALAHTAPKRDANALPEIEGFVMTALERLFPLTT